MTLGDKTIELGDYWEAEDLRPIHVKEAEAILQTLLSLKDSVANSRLDVRIDNMSVIGAWNGQGSKCHLLTDVLKRIFCFVADYNVDLHLQYVPTLQNLADPHPES